MFLIYITKNGESPESGDIMLLKVEDIPLGIEFVVLSNNSNQGEYDVVVAFLEAYTYFSR